MARPRRLLTVEPQRRRNVDSEELEDSAGLVHRVVLQLGIKSSIFDTRSSELRLSDGVRFSEHVEADDVAEVGGDVVWFEEEVVGAVASCECTDEDIDGPLG